MAFDSKRFRMFKWLDKVANTQGHVMPYNHIYTIYGSLYATSGIILARIDYPEFEHIHDDGIWRVVLEYQDENGKHLDYPMFGPAVPQMRSRIFDDQFIGPELQYICTQAYDAKYIAECMYPFKLYGIHPTIAHDGPKLEFTGHNREVSMKVLMMGVTR